ncbi:MAG TPA: EAL domain-containing protein [Symbiobacteriaceae bacterium]|nr:EAL domain-containing protein [Symbiobacteriaceae bacterium]
MSTNKGMFAEAVIDSLFAHVCVLDAAGRILAVNRAWRRFGEANGLPAGVPWEGTNYLAVCDAASSEVPEAARIAAGIRAVLRGEQPEVSLEYCCHAPWEDRWFITRATRVSGQENAAVLITHENITARKLYEQQLEYRATHDELTGLPNRTWLHERLRALGEGTQSLAVLFVNLKRLQRINNAFGYPTGDQLLHKAGERLRQALPSEALVCRYAGSEFVVVLPGAGAGAMQGLASSAAAELGRPFQIGRYEIVLHVEMGIAVRQGREAPEMVLGRADAARRKAKAQASTVPVLYDQSMAQISLDQMLLEEELQFALDLGQMMVHFQPIVELKTGRAIGAEALVRWRHPQLGMVPPDRFIALAEETGAIHQLGRFVLLDACRRLVDWGDRGPGYVSVNVSVRQFLRPGFPGEVASVLKETGLPAQRLQLEVTESLVMQDVEYAQTVMQILRGLGVRLALDDFGKGYSSLTYLRHFPLDVIKVDRDFTRAMGHDSSSEAVIEAVIALGRALKMKVTVEGVETAQQAERLLAMGCDRVQGYYFGRPVPADDLPGVLETLRGP